MLKGSGTNCRNGPKGAAHNWFLTPLTQRRWSLHILPKGYTKTRRFGGYSNRHGQRYMAECHQRMATDEAAPITAANAEISETPREHLCPNCNVPLRVVSRTNRPGWAIIMNSVHRPHWYNDG